MIATVAWLAILTTAIVWEAVSHAGSGWVTLTTMALWLWRNPARADRLHCRSWCSSGGTCSPAAHLHAE